MMNITVALLIALSVALTIAAFIAGRRLGAMANGATHTAELNQLRTQAQEAQNRLERDLALALQASGQANQRNEESESRARLMEERVLELGRQLTTAQSELSAARTLATEQSRQLADQANKADATTRALTQERDELAKKRETDHQQLQEQATALGQFAELQEQFKRLQTVVDDHKSREDNARRELIAARQRIAELETAMAKEAQSLAREREQFDKSREVLKQEFQNVAHQIFDQKQQLFQEQSKHGLDALLAPFKQQLESFRQRVDEVHTQNVEGASTLRAELQNLKELNQKITDEAANLTRALKGDKKIRGNWGELKVEMLLEQSNLRKGFEYEREKTLVNDNADKYRPDFLVKLPEGKHIIIDSKVSLVAYNDYIAADTDEARQVALQAHIQAFRNHISGLSAKAYPELIGVNSPDFVFMFVGVEPAYLTIAEHVPSLFQEAYDKRIAIVTATTLVPVLRVVSNLWMLQQRNQSTKELADQAALVYDKLCGFVAKMEKLGSQIETVGKTYKDAFSTLKDGRGSLTNKVDRFVELGVKVRARLPASVITEDAVVGLEGANAEAMESDTLTSSL